MGLADELRDLQELHEKGQLSDAEYAAAKAAVINESSSAQALPSEVSPPAVTPTRKSSGCFMVFIVIVVMILLLVGIESLENDKSSSTPSTSGSSVSTPQNPAISSTGNPANDRMLGLPQSQQAAFLGMAVQEGCIGTTAFYMGSYTKDNSAFWSVRCADGKEYEVEISADDVGSTKVLECSFLRRVVKVNCFEKLQ